MSNKIYDNAIENSLVEFEKYINQNEELDVETRNAYIQEVWGIVSRKLQDIGYDDVIYDIESKIKGLADFKCDDINVESIEEIIYTLASSDKKMLDDREYAKKDLKENSKSDEKETFKDSSMQTLVDMNDQSEFRMKDYFEQIAEIVPIIVETTLQEYGVINADVSVNAYDFESLSDYSLDIYKATLQNETTALIDFVNNEYEKASRAEEMVKEEISDIKVAEIRAYNRKAIEDRGIDPETLENAYKRYIRNDIDNYNEFSTNGKPVKIVFFNDNDRPQSGLAISELILQNNILENRESFMESAQKFGIIQQGEYSLILTEEEKERMDRRNTKPKEKTVDKSRAKKDIDDDYQIYL